MTIKGKFCAAEGVDYDTSGIRAVPNFKLRIEADRDSPKPTSFNSYIADLSVF